MPQKEYELLDDGDLHKHKSHPDKEEIREREKGWPARSLPHFFLTSFSDKEGWKSDKDDAGCQSLKENDGYQIITLEEGLPFLPHNLVELRELAQAEEVIEEGSLVAHRGNIKGVILIKLLPCPGFHYLCHQIIVEGLREAIVDVRFLPCDTGIIDQVKPPLPGELLHPVYILLTQRAMLQQECDGSPAPQDGDMIRGMCCSDLFQSRQEEGDQPQLYPGRREEVQGEAQEPFGLQVSVEVDYALPGEPIILYQPVDAGGSCPQEIGGGVKNDIKFFLAAPQIAPGLGDDHLYPAFLVVDVSRKLSVIFVNHLHHQGIHLRHPYSFRAMMEGGEDI